ncbi:ribonuclease H-like domain-containing protein [Tanacetum coccineum]|uniref:Ribonuclease H-like domain-containing protein n=1 Tax=Tanacetum coccineum TaxID=301880 RepID=A0ABQ5HYJ0_9ASTR
MLADSLLPTVFWAEAVNTACYVLNRVLVTKPHNKTPYELIIGRPPSISFMRPFGCPVTILNTLDPLGKFDGKAEEGFLVSVDAGQSKEKNVSTQQYIMFPLWSSISSRYKSSDETYKNDTADDAVGETPCNRELLQWKATRASSTNNFNIVSTPVNAASAPRTANDTDHHLFLLVDPFLLMSMILQMILSCLIWRILLKFNQ